MKPQNPKTKLSIRVTDSDKISRIAEWCKDNLAKEEWDIEPIHLFKPDYKFHFVCDKTRLQVILEHL